MSKQPKRVKVMDDTDTEDTDTVDDTESSEVPLKASESASAKLGLSKATYRAKAGDNIVEWWGGDQFPCARITKDGMAVAFGVTCAKHDNADGTHSGTPCKKWLTLGPGMTDTEAKLRLKRWILVGKLQEHSFDANTQRKCHIAAGGKPYLCDLAPDVCGWADLDADLDELLKTC